MGNILEGKKLADEIKLGVRKDVDALNRLGIDVGIALMLVGDNPASIQYFKTTVGTCRQVGITAYEYRLPNQGLSQRDTQHGKCHQCR